MQRGLCAQRRAICNVAQAALARAANSPTGSAGGAAPGAGSSCSRKQKSPTSSENGLFRCVWPGGNLPSFHGSVRDGKAWVRAAVAAR